MQIIISLYKSNYLTDNYGLQCSQFAFRAYINKRPEFKAHFDAEKRMTSNHLIGIRYETQPGEQVQLDWKENIQFEM